MLSDKSLMNYDFILCEFNNQRFVTVANKIQVKDLYLEATWIITGEIKEIIIPKRTISKERLDNLWQDTCFELFLKAQQQENYFEYNFSPDKNWNCYQFKNYRSGMEFYKTIEPEIDFQVTNKSLILSAQIEIPPELKIEQNLAIAITAVLNTPKGLSYWALKHLKEKPDFHSYFEPINL